MREKLPTSVLKLMAREVQAMEDHGPGAVVVAEAVVEATAEAAVTHLEEAEDLHATLPVIVDRVLVHKWSIVMHFCRISCYTVLFSVQSFFLIQAVLFTFANVLDIIV